MRRIEAIAVMMMLAAATPAMAQGRGNGGVPPGQRPPAGMCRIWIDGVPPGRQPAPTSCAAAERYVPRNGQVIYGANTDRRAGRIYSSNGQVFLPQRTRQGCVQRTDRTGVTRTYCDNTNQIDPRIDARANRDARRRLDERKQEYKKAKKHHDGDRDDDWNRDQNRQHSDRDRDNDWNRHRN